MCPCLLAVAALLAAAEAPSLSEADVLARARPAAEELAVEAELAAVRRLLVETRAGLAEGPSVGLVAGPRRRESSTSADLELDLDWPLLSRGAGARSRLEGALAAAEVPLRAAALAERRSRLRAAYVTTWAAQESVALRGADLTTVERWLAATRRRVEAGADAPYEVDLVAVELDEARAALVAAESDRLRSWATLGALAEIPIEPQPLGEPAGPTSGLGEGFRVRCAAGALARAVGARATLGEARLRLEAAREQSRLALRSSLAREGDEEVALVGLAYRVPRGGEPQVVAAHVEGQLAALRRQAELETAELRARCEGSGRLAQGLARAPAPTDPSRALDALDLRLTEGKSRPSEVLPLRRSLLAARQSALQRRAAVLTAAADLEALTTGVSP